MAAEIYVTILTGFRLGHLLHYGRELSAMDQVIGIMLVIIVIGLVTDKNTIRTLGAFHAPTLGHRSGSVACVCFGAPIRPSASAPRLLV